jgi:hypothetical protein
MGVLGALVLFVFAQIVNLYIKTSLHVGFNTSVSEGVPTPLHHPTQRHGSVFFDLP